MQNFLGKGGGQGLENNTLAIRYLGIVSISLVVVFGIWGLAVLGFNTYFKYSDNKKEIEVRAENSNSSNTIE